MLPRWEESLSEGLGELHPLEAETLVQEELETEVGGGLAGYSPVP
jgi:hypothetical protein